MVSAIERFHCISINQDQLTQIEQNFLYAPLYPYSYKRACKFEDDFGIFDQNMIYQILTILVLPVPVLNSVNSFLMISSISCLNIIMIRAEETGQQNDVYIYTK